MVKRKVISIVVFYIHVWVKMQEERRSCGSAGAKPRLVSRVGVGGEGSFLRDENGLPMPDIDNLGFSNMIKEVTANQMTDADVWNVRLIDYFAEMKHLHANGDSINFQTAGAALQGCVSVLSKKIDSAVMGANLLVRGLAIKSSKDADADSEVDDDDPEFKISKRVKRKPKVERDPYKVALVPFNRFKTTDKDQLFEMRDPVFMKFIAAFDEGGAKALLTNTLRIDPSCRVCIDDVTTRISTTESNVKKENDINDGVQSGVADSMDVLSEETKVTVSSLNSWMLKSDIGTLGHVSLCSEISNVRKSIEDEDYGRDYVKATIDKIEQNQHSFGEPNVDYDIADFYDGGAADAVCDGFDLHLSQGEPNMSTSSQRSIPNDTLGLGSNDFLLTQEEAETNAAQQLEVMKMLDDKFSRKLKRPQWQRDWKIKNVAFVKEKSAVLEHEKDEEVNHIDQAPPPEPKPSARENLIDFLNAKDNFSIFEMPSIKLEKTISVKENTMNDENTWSSERLVRSFIKPKRKFRNMFTKKTRVISVNIDHEFWAKQYNDKETTQELIDEDAADFLREAMDDGHVVPVDDLLGANGLDDADEVNVANGYDFDAPVDFDLPSSSFVENDHSSPAPPSSQRKTIQHAKRSKRVDVKLLKKNLSEVIHHVHIKDEYPHEILDNDELKRKTKVNVKLSEVVKDTAMKYDGYQRNELSTSFYFICMLHLANEQGFSIESTANDDDVIITGDAIMTKE